MGRPMMDHLRDTGRIDVARAARWGAIAVLSALLLLSCEPPSYTTIEWQTDGDGFDQYSTNDPGLLNTIHYDPRPEENEVTMTTVTATVKKVSGSSVDGFGIVFCYQNDNNHYCLLISASGYYKVMKIVGGALTVLVDRTFSTDLDTGWGVPNDISVTQAPVGTFTVKFNGNPIPPFTDGSFLGGLAGPCIGIGLPPHERFPGVPADARFQMLAPVLYP
jgi:hypothetical protein